MKTIKDNLEIIPYKKSPISIMEQVQKFKSCGFIIDDKNITANNLSKINYYRFRTNTDSFQGSADSKKQYKYQKGHLFYNFPKKRIHALFALRKLYADHSRILNSHLIMNMLLLTKCRLHFPSRSMNTTTKCNMLFTYPCGITC